MNTLKYNIDIIGISSIPRYNSLRIRLSHTRERTSHMVRVGVFNQSSKRQLNDFGVNYCHLQRSVRLL